MSAAAESLIEAVQTCESETVKQGEVQKVKNLCQWVKRPVVCPGGWHQAVLSINGEPYAASSFCTGDESTGSWWQVVDLRKPDGTHYRLTFGPDGDHCDCPHSVYRNLLCKHPKAVRAALEWLERVERAEQEWRSAQAELAAAAVEEPAF